MDKKATDASIVEVNMDLINNEIEGRHSPNEIALFKSVGIAVQDLFVANAVYNRSLTN
jgi:ornithine cyclodeaminase/alanine dehydrogenase-like protein (mu-crystallin family)